MESAANLIGEPLKWEQTSSINAKFRLLKGDDEIMTLRLLSGVTWAAVVENGKGYDIEQFNAGKAGGVRITPKGAAESVATYAADDHTRSGVLSFTDGRKLTGQGDPNYRFFEFRNEARETVLRVDREKGFLRFHGRSELLPPAAAFSGDTWLLALGAYLLLLALGEPGI